MHYVRHRKQGFPMLTLKEVLDDAAAAPGFEGLPEVGVNSRGSNGETPLHWMATLGDPEGIRLLVSAGAKVNATDSEGNSPLHEAVAMRQTSAVQALIAHGANTQLKNALGKTAQDISSTDGFEPVASLLQRHK